MGEITGGVMDDAQLLAFADGGAAADEAFHALSQLLLLNGESKRPAQQSDSDQRDFLPGHGRSMSGVCAKVKWDEWRGLISPGRVPLEQGHFLFAMKRPARSFPHEL
jgi:hypothetical protein